MKRYTEDELYNISIEECGLINLSNIDPVYKFCKNNNIKNIGQFIEVYRNKVSNQEMNKKYSFEYFDGIIDLLLLYFCNKPLKLNDLFFKQIMIRKNPFSNSYYGCIDNIYINNTKRNSLRKLGLTNNECRVLLFFVVFLGKEMTVINAIKAYKSFKENNSNIRINRKEQEIFMRKLDILDEYYDNNINLFNHKSNYKLNKIEELFNKYEELMKKKLEIDDNLSNIAHEIEENVERLNNEDTMQLVKRFGNKFIAN